MVDADLIITAFNDRFVVALLMTHAERVHYLGIIRSDVMQVLYELRGQGAMTADTYSEMCSRITREMPEERMHTQFADALENLLVSIFTHKCKNSECSPWRLLKLAAATLRLGQLMKFEDLHVDVS